MFAYALLYIDIILRSFKSKNTFNVELLAKSKTKRAGFGCGGVCHILCSLSLALNNIQLMLKDDLQFGINH